MQALSYSEARANLSSLMDKVNDDHAPMLVTRQGGRPVVVMSLDDFTAWEETTYLLRSPANAQRLTQAIAALDSGAGQAHDLVEP
jgi:antitoxin YefM